MFAVTQNHHRQSHWFVNNIVRHCRWIMAHLVLHFSGQLRSICCCIFFSSSSLLKLPLSAHTNTNTNTDTSVQFENNKRKAMCLAQLLNSCLVCVSWGGCTSVAGPSIRPMHGPQTSRYKDDKYPHLWKRAGGGETDGCGKREAVTDIKMEWLREELESYLVQLTTLTLTLLNNRKQLTWQNAAD